MSSSGLGLALESEGRQTRLKWHRLRRQMIDPLFSAEVMAEGFRLGASMEIDLRVRADGGFVVLHDEDLQGETIGRGAIRECMLADLKLLHMKDGSRPLILSEDLAPMLQAAHPGALMQFDMKDDFAVVGDKGIAHLARYFHDVRAPVIVSGHSYELIIAVKNRLPWLLRGIDPTDKLVAIGRDDGLAAVERELISDLRGPTEPDTVYLYWPLILNAAEGGLDLIALSHSEGKKVDAWTFTLSDREHGFSETEWRNFSALMALAPDQITTDEASATELAWLKHAAQKCAAALR